MQDVSRSVPDQIGRSLPGNCVDAAGNTQKAVAGRELSDHEDLADSIDREREGRIVSAGIRFG